MERLTERYKDSIANTVLIKECGDKLCKDICDDIECDCSKCELEKALEKLADYEDLEEQGLLVRFDAIGKEDMGESCYRLEDIGRIVFLTHEEAEKKLEESQNGKK